MSPLKRTAAGTLSAVLLAGSLAGPAAAASSKHWSKTQCKSYVTSFHKNHAHATSAQKTTADKLLKSKGCTQKV